MSKGDTSVNAPFNPYRYTAKRLDSGSQTYDMGARRFDPSAQRFLQMDQFQGALADLGLVSDPLTQNRYALAASNPLSAVEYDGHMLVADGGGGAAPSPQPGSPKTSQTAASDGKAGQSLCGFTSYCTAPWPLPPKPPTQRPAPSYMCSVAGHPTICATQTRQYQNANSDTTLLFNFLLGTGNRVQYFNQWDPMTQSLMRDGNVQETKSIITRDLRAGGPYRDTHNYKDNPNVTDFIMDGLGFISGGTFGHNYADSYTGSYDLRWVAIQRNSHTATAYFTATNVTDLNSLVHPEKTFPAIPIIGGYLSLAHAIPRSIDLPWDAGPFSNTQQVFQWQETIRF